MDITKELEEAIKTTQARHAVYGEGYRTLANVFMAMFPKGMSITSEKDAEAFFFTYMMIVKMVRFAESINMEQPAHLDSLHDLGVYAFMAERWHREMEEKMQTLEDRILGGEFNKSKEPFCGYYEGTGIEVCHRPQGHGGRHYIDNCICCPHKRHSSCMAIHKPMTTVEGVIGFCNCPEGACTYNGKCTTRGAD